MGPRLWDRYEPATRCTGTDRPGAVALMEWVCATYPHAANWGIAACRPVEGGSILSVHAEGRAIDIGLEQGGEWAQRLADDLVWRSRDLQVQCVIYNRQEWSADRWDEGWRPYPGENDHRDHLHVELSRWSGNTLTRGRIERAMSGGGATTHLPAEADHPHQHVLPAFVHARPGHGPGCRCPRRAAGHRGTGVVAADIAGVGVATAAVPRGVARRTVGAANG